MWDPKYSLEYLQGDKQASGSDRVQEQILALNDAEAIERYHARVKELRDENPVDGGTFVCNLELIKTQTLVFED